MFIRIYHQVWNFFSLYSRSLLFFTPVLLRYDGVH